MRSLASTYMGSYRLCTSTRTSTFFLFAASTRTLCSCSSLTGGLVTRTCNPLSIAANAILQWVLSGVKIVTASPGENWSRALRAFFTINVPSAGKVEQVRSMSLYTFPMLFSMCWRICGIFLPFVPTNPNLPTFPRRRKSNMARYQRRQHPYQRASRLFPLPQNRWCIHLCQSSTHLPFYRHRCRQSIVIIKIVSRLCLHLSWECRLTFEQVRSFRKYEDLLFSSSSIIDDEMSKLIIIIINHLNNTKHTCCILVV